MRSLALALASVALLAPTLDAQPRRGRADSALVAAAIRGLDAYMRHEARPDPSMTTPAPLPRRRVWQFEFPTAPASADWRAVERFVLALDEGTLADSAATEFKMLRLSVARQDRRTIVFAYRFSGHKRCKGVWNGSMVEYEISVPRDPRRSVLEWQQVACGASMPGTCWEEAVERERAAREKALWDRVRTSP